MPTPGLVQQVSGTRVTIIGNLLHRTILEGSIIVSRFVETSKWWKSKREIFLEKSQDKFHFLLIIIFANNAFSINGIINLCYVSYKEEEKAFKGGGREITCLVEWRISFLAESLLEAGKTVRGSRISRKSTVCDRGKPSSEVVLTKRRRRRKKGQTKRATRLT